MDDLIKEHYNSEDIQGLNLYRDVKNWYSEVQYLDNENQFYLELFASSLIKKTDLNQQDINFLNEELEMLKKKTDEVSHKLRDFLIEQEGMKECDDIHCETFFLNTHQKFKLEIENYFQQNRSLKTMLFSHLLKGIKKFL
ncbi:hypothetical protein LZ575_10925 [Antarcticibacterium sp. 1MA-6-2]|uniref:hypothetical protein n=1 Tax=Antarcticibacterium sp. 1MA-6-2 TaxID=2908210 RepID=UPI001F188CFD|nr:hypothetical protein [Antarcticibacterium sp. 1MA-6-2]UJH92874.1 hypothetical protein LZ575_10925 [Antarcticibacterium sp. 1MA-6-2]